MTKPKPAEKGQSLVEMALSAVLIIFLLMATIDFGYAFLYWITVRDAAQEGAVYGSLHPGPACDTTLRARVKAANSSPLIRIDNLPDSQIVVTRTGNLPGNTINVKVTLYYQVQTPLVSQFLNNSQITLSTNVTNTILQVDASCP